MPMLAIKDFSFRPLINPQLLYPLRVEKSKFESEQGLNEKGLNTSYPDSWYSKCSYPNTSIALD